MGCKERDINEFVEPAIKCSDSLTVNQEKKNFLFGGIVFTIFFVFGLKIAISNNSILSVILVSIFHVLVLAMFIGAYLARNPVVIIDKNVS